MGADPARSSGDSIEVIDSLMHGQHQTHFELLGGEDGVRRLVDRFYDVMDSHPAAADIRAMHPTDLTGSREKLFLFLCGWTGGPPLYVKKFGHPKLRARHLPFPIGAPERDAWVQCMDVALDEAEMPEMLREYLKQRFRAVADHMRNQAE